MNIVKNKYFFEIDENGMFRCYKSLTTAKSTGQRLGQKLADERCVSVEVVVGAMTFKEDDNGHPISCDKEIFEIYKF